MKLNIDTWVNTPGKKWIARVPVGQSLWGITDGMTFEELDDTSKVYDGLLGLECLSGEFVNSNYGFKTGRTCSCPAQYLEEYLDNNEDTFQAPVFQSITIGYLGRADGAPTFTAKFSDGTEMRGIVTEVVRAT